jgi:S-adenosylmethionine decarboxylase
MKRFGDCVVVNFGEDERVAGFSMTQLIETSLISAHFANQNNATYLDIFSCKYYTPVEAAIFAKEFFKAKDFNLTYTLRK